MILLMQNFFSIHTQNKFYDFALKTAHPLFYKSAAIKDQNFLTALGYYPEKPNVIEIYPISTLATTNIDLIKTTFFETRMEAEKFYDNVIFTCSPQKMQRDLNGSVNLNKVSYVFEKDGMNLLLSVKQSDSGFKFERSSNDWPLINWTHFNNIAVQKILEKFI